MFDHESAGTTAMRLTGLPATASGPQRAEGERGTDVRPVERIEPAPVVAQTSLESATVQATEIDDFGGSSPDLELASPR